MMVVKRNGIVIRLMVASGFLFPSTPVFAGQDSSTTTTFSGYASFESGEVMKGISMGYASATSDVDHGWVEKAEFGLYADAKINERLHIILGPEGTLTRSFKTYPGTLNDQYIEDYKPMFEFSLGRAEGIYTFGNPDRALFQLETGYFSYKYDKDARNFGEYLFRATPYPTLFYNKFDRPFTYLLGFRAGNTLWNNFHHDLFLTSEMTEYMGSLGDFSLSYLAEYKMPGLYTTNSWLTVGGGISLYRVFSVNEQNTTPHNTNSFLRLDNVQWTYNPGFNNVSATGDSVFQSYAGTKLMGRVSFDIAGLIKPFTGDLWKSGDIVLYSELAVLGVKNYTAYSYDKAFGDTSRVAVVDTTRTFYNKLKERMPLMVGFTFRIPYDILDVVNCELEYLDSRYPNNVETGFRGVWGVIPPFAARHEKLKWSFYAKKCLGPHTSIIGQIANDHFLPTTHVNMQGGQGAQDFQDVTLRHGDWWWVLKVKFDY
ncbi:MAG: hypothetical protein ABSF80_06060 [Chitinispirillaceae bacterium]